MPIFFKNYTKNLSFCRFYEPKVATKGVFLRWFNFDIKKLVFAFFLVVLPLSFMALDRSKLENHFLFRAVVWTSSQTLSFYHLFATSIKDTTDTYLNLLHTKKENRQLKAENRQLKVQVALLQEKEKENQRFRDLLNFQKGQNVAFIPAQVISYDPISKYQLITINRGKIHGVRKKMLAVAEQGVVGYVFRVLSHFSQIILLTDPHTAILAVIKRSRVRGVVEGEGGQFYKLKYLKSRDDVQKGDTVITSDLDLLSLKGLPIGQVIEVQKQGLTQDVTIQPFVNPSRLEEVLIVLKKEGS